MKLYYFQFKTGKLNFGDDINPWMWEKLGVPLDKNGWTFVGVGTVLNDLLPKGEKVVLGSGAGYGDVPQDSSEWKVLCVRGPLTAEKLGLAPELAVTDAAILLRNLIQPAANKKYDISFIPHVSNDNHGWRDVCKRAGIHYITPDDEVTNVIDQINKSKKIICEAMHGAIVADTFRVPWSPVVTTEDILSFKWRDWCGSMEMEYKPRQLPPVWGHGRTASLRSYLKRLFATHKLKSIENNAEFFLSDDQTFNSRLEKMNMKVKDLKRLLEEGVVW